jgi:hypothetical protein
LTTAGATGVSVLGINLMSSLEWPVVVGSLLVGTYGVVTYSAAILDDWKQKQQTAEQHNLYFYLKAGQRLSSRFH